MSLRPPVPTGGYCQFPAWGVTINEAYVPPKTTIVAPRYSLARLKSSDGAADGLVPKRWAAGDAAGDGQGRA